MLNFLDLFTSLSMEKKNKHHKTLSLKASSVVDGSASNAIGEYARTVFQPSIILIKKIAQNSYGLENFIPHAMNTTELRLVSGFP